MAFSTFLRLEKKDETMNQLCFVLSGIIGDVTEPTLSMAMLT